MGCKTENFVFVIEDGVLKEFYLKTNCRYLIVPEGGLELDSGIFRDDLKFRVISFHKVVLVRDPFLVQRDRRICNDAYAAVPIKWKQYIKWII